MEVDAHPDLPYRYPRLRHYDYGADEAKETGKGWGVSRIPCREIGTRLLLVQTVFVTLSRKCAWCLKRINT